MTDRLETAGEGPAMDTSRLQGPDADPDRPDGAVRLRPAVHDALVVAGVYLLLGLAGGLLWWLLVDPAVFTKASDGGAMGEVQLGKRFDGDAWYAVIAGLGGLVSGLLVSGWRSRDHLLTTVLVALGACAAAAVMALTGHLLGPGDADAALATAKEGATVPVQLAVTAQATYLVWPIAALLGSLVVLWSPSRDSRD